MDETQEIIKEQLKKLPEDVRKAIASVDLRDKIKRISEKHHLHIDQGGELENETVLVMLGLESAYDYRMNLKRGLQISDSRAQAIAFDIDKEIFMNIRESLKKISQEEDTDSEIGEMSNYHTEAEFSGVEKNIEEDKRAEESEEIKKQIAKQQIAKPSPPPPPNLPTEKSAEPSHLGNELLSEKKPIHIDPYREHID
ncbi:hypothetical protein COT82_01265 [Candidatus Campbellbacteria bacterium CG10_big_fil_rev_8_21_14_0_10_35_52]|uniref:Uncharacterized protein n=1 Tax=Candidatus Campbellbacteria bacterium CG10_big_fil_rev_8_21_14_0_10_35_52 TaxID=1974527 RepID=A0A2M6WVK5_9BACT|nr:MAG: hypothetical protein COT82_01265 [Candidatus Campbellbacteria bacterium CG10_big_fil_rev_8_21_14_0_10_35_52]